MFQQRQEDAEIIKALKDKLTEVEKELDAALYCQRRIPKSELREQLAATEAPLQQYRKVLECMGPTPHAPNLTKQMYHAALAKPCPTTALNNAIADELERLADEVTGASWVAKEALLKRAEELRG